VTIDLGVLIAAIQERLVMERRQICNFSMLKMILIVHNAKK